jgi:drug/metabolite transporter (DMT)-like permease
MSEPPADPGPNKVGLYLSVALSIFGVLLSLGSMVTYAMYWLQGRIGLEGNFATGMGLIGAMMGGVVLIIVGVVGIVRSARMPPPQ